MKKSPPISTAILTEWVCDARRRTLELVDDLSDEQWRVPPLAVVNPLSWSLGHLAWLQEKWLSRRNGRPSLRPEADSLYDARAVPRARRWDVPLPSREESKAYLREVQDRILELLQGDPTAEELLLVEHAVFREDLEGEALLHARQTLAYPAPRLAVAGEMRAAAGALPGDVEVPGGRFVLGAAPRGRFVFDNEQEGHVVEVRPFFLARAPVTQGEFMAFVERGGYYRSELWSSDGWRWRQATDARHPIYWRRASNGTWMRRHFDHWLALEPDRPAQYVSWYEAEAYCQWVKRRLPTEAEWEAAAAWEPAANGGLAPSKRRFPWGDSPPTPDHAQLDARNLGSAEVAACPIGDSAFGCRQMIGNVWEWTASDFLPYPGFAPGPDSDYSPPCFGTHKVLRGGSWATRARLLRNTFRFFAIPSRADLGAGFRTCKL